MRHCSISRAAGFTLLEVVIAIALTAVAVGVAASALTSATLVKERVAAHRESLELDVRFRTTLIDMLRHAPAADGVDEPLMRVTRTTGGEPQLVFLSTGVQPPYGSGGAWRVTVTGIATGISLTAEPIGSEQDRPLLSMLLRAPMRAQLRTPMRAPMREPMRGPMRDELRTTDNDTPSLHIRFLEQTGGRSAPRWRDDWPLERSRPAAISLRFSNDVTAPPLLVELNPLQLAVGRP